MSSPDPAPRRFARMVRPALEAGALLGLAGLLSADLWWNVGLPLRLEWWRMEVMATLADPGIAQLLALGLALHAVLWTAYAASDAKQHHGPSRLRTLRRRRPLRPRRGRGRADLARLRPGGLRSPRGAPLASWPTACGATPAVTSF